LDGAAIKNRISRRFSSCDEPVHVAGSEDYFEDGVDNGQWEGGVLAQSAKGRAQRAKTHRARSLPSPFLRKAPVKWSSGIELGKHFWVNHTLPFLPISALSSFG